MMKLVVVEDRGVDRLESEGNTRETSQRVGKYQLLRLLAVGGMAEVYLARESGPGGFDRLVVIKRVLPQFEADADFVAMFLDEARLAATLQHPNIVQVFGVDEHDGRHFIAMEYLRGHDLGRVLGRAAAAKRRLPLQHALTIVHGAAAGLHHAHESRGPGGMLHGIVHRDVSPQNVVITFDGCVKLVDFGIAKAVARGSKTAEGVVKGKVSYMSPEQCSGKRLDRRSDLFSLGIVLWELTTGRKLFKGASEYVIANQLLNEAIPTPSSRVPDYPPPLEALVMRMLSRDPDERPATAEQVQLELEEIARTRQTSLSQVGLGGFMRELYGEDRGAWEELESEQPSTPMATAVARPAAARARPIWPWLAGVGVVGAIGVATWALGRDPAPAPPTQPPAMPAAAPAPQPVPTQPPPPTTRAPAPETITTPAPAPSVTTPPPRRRSSTRRRDPAPTAATTPVAPASAPVTPPPAKPATEVTPEMLELEKKLLGKEEEK